MEYESFTDLIDAWPSISDFADDLGVSYQTAYRMRDRQSIASDHWHSVVESAKERKIEDVSYQTLARLKATKKSTSVAC